MTDLSPTFEGITFCTLSEILYQKFEIVLFALEITDLRNEKNGTKLLLNPAEFIIPTKSEYDLKAFVIAKNKAQSDLSFSSNDESGIFSNNFSQLSVLAANIAKGVSFAAGDSKVLPTDDDESISGNNSTFAEKQVLSSLYYLLSLSLLLLLQLYLYSIITIIIIIKLLLILLLLLQLYL